MTILAHLTFQSTTLIVARHAIRQQLHPLEPMLQQAGPSSCGLVGIAHARHAGLDPEVILQRILRVKIDGQGLATAQAQAAGQTGALGSFANPALGRNQRHDMRLALGWAR